MVLNPNTTNYKQALGRFVLYPCIIPCNNCRSDGQLVEMINKWKQTKDDDLWQFLIVYVRMFLVEKDAYFTYKGRRRRPPPVETSLKDNSFKTITPFLPLPAYKTIFIFFLYFQVTADGYQKEFRNFSVVGGRVTRLDLQVLKLRTSTIVISDPTGSSDSLYRHFSPLTLCAIITLLNFMNNGTVW